ncbi:uncharacterized protein [Leptinotarsa decemlineata]|uniref:uncharacterized protein n=1 Tax=Leptinotarsa decemlineata TaxID=7539 RepID=UPI003D3094ED
MNILYQDFIQNLTLTIQEYWNLQKKKRKTECDTQIYEFDPATGSLIEETDSENNGLEELNKEEENRAAKAYRKCPPGILQKPVNQKLMVSPSCQSKETEKVQTSLSISVSTKNSSTPKAKPFNRRRPIGGIRALTSSDIAEKYNILLDKRLALVEKQLEQIVESQNYAKEEQQYKSRMLKLQEENLRLDTKKKQLKLELLQFEISYKKSLLTHDDK